MINDREHRASSLVVKVEIRSQKIQTYTATVSGGQRRALWTGTARVASYWMSFVRPHESIRVGAANLVSTFKHIVSCHFHDKHMRLRRSETEVNACEM